MSETVNVNTNRVSPLQALHTKRNSLERQLRQVNEDIRWIEAKEARAAAVASDIAASGRTDIPTLTQIVEWDLKFRAEYRRQHQARNDAILASTQSADNPLGMPLEVAGQSAQEILDQDAAIETHVTTNVEELSELRGNGYEAARAEAESARLGQRTPKLSSLTPPEGLADPVAWWVGAYQHCGLL